MTSPPPDLGRSVNPISIRGPDCAHLITTRPLGFSKVPTALMYLGTLSYNAILTLFKYKILLEFQELSVIKNLQHAASSLRTGI